MTIASLRGCLDEADAPDVKLSQATRTSPPVSHEDTTCDFAFPEPRKEALRDLAGGGAQRTIRGWTRKANHPLRSPGGMWSSICERGPPMPDSTATPDVPRVVYGVGAHHMGGIDEHATVKDLKKAWPFPRPAR